LKRRLSLLLIVVGLVAVLGLLSSVVTQGFVEVAEAEAEMRQLEEERARIERHIEHLEATLASARGNPEAVESMARRELGWIRPGERVIILATPTPDAAPPALTGELPEPILRLPD
jgi:cell division protein FtsB